MRRAGWKPAWVDGHSCGLKDSQSGRNRIESERTGWIAVKPYYRVTVIAECDERGTHEAFQIGTAVTEAVEAAYDCGALLRGRLEGGVQGEDWTGRERSVCRISNAVVHGWVRGEQR